MSFTSFDIRETRDLIWCTGVFCKKMFSTVSYRAVSKKKKKRTCISINILKPFTMEH